MPNSELRREVENLELRVILGNPPYSIGQSSQDDDNQNEKYPALDTRIAETYVASANKGSLKKSLYDSYIRAFRWGSDKITERGVIAFVTNAGWLDSTSANGLRLCLVEEFSSIYIYHLKGNQRTTSGEQSRKEGGKVFGAGSRAPIAITFLVKNPETTEQGQTYFASVDDYLTREQKLQQLRDMGSVLNPQVPLIRITPDAHGDWFNQRSDDFDKFISIAGKDNAQISIFTDYSGGVVTTRDAWSFNSSKQTLSSSFKRCIAFYNTQVSLANDAKAHGKTFVKAVDAASIKWSAVLERKLEKGVYSSDFSPTKVVLAVYRPFIAQWLYFDAMWVHSWYCMPQLFPFAGAENLTIVSNGVGRQNISYLMTNCITDLNCMDSGHATSTALLQKPSLQPIATPIPRQTRSPSPS